MAASWMKSVLDSYHAHVAAATVGTICVIATAVMLENWVLLCASIPYGFIFLMAREYRQKAIMRTRQGWVCNSLLSVMVSAAAVCIGYTHSATADALYAYLLVAIAALFLLLAAHPVFDYGLLLVFLRLPVQIALANFNTRLNDWPYAADVGLLVVGTILQCYMNSEAYLSMYKVYEATPTAEVAVTRTS